jgi:arylsulfatase A-like enzyme
MPGVDGINVLPALRGKETPRSDYFYWEHHQKTFSQAVREGHLKAIRENPDGPIAVYDVVADPAEKQDLAATQPGFVARARELFVSARTESEHWPVTPKKTKTP